MQLSGALTRHLHQRRLHRHLDRSIAPRTLSLSRKCSRENIFRTPAQSRSLAVQVHRSFYLVASALQDGPGFFLAVLGCMMLCVAMFLALSPTIAVPTTITR
jgi:hypothetical protein